MEKSARRSKAVRSCVIPAVMESCVTLAKSKVRFKGFFFSHRRRYFPPPRIASYPVRAQWNKSCIHTSYGTLSCDEAISFNLINFDKHSGTPKWLIVSGLLPCSSYQKAHLVRTSGPQARVRRDGMYSFKLFFHFIRVQSKVAAKINTDACHGGCSTIQLISSVAFLKPLLSQQYTQAGRCLRPRACRFLVHIRNVKNCVVYTKSIYHHFVAQEQNDQWIITLSAMKPMKTKSLWSRNAQLHNILPEGPRVLSGLWPSGIPLHRSPIIISSNSAIPGTSLCKWLPLCNVHYIVVYLVHTLVVGLPFTVVYHMLCLLSPDGAAPHLTQSPWSQVPQHCTTFSAQHFQF